MEQDSILSVHAVLRLIEHYRVRSLHGFIITFYSSLSWQAVHEDSVLLHIFPHELPCHLEEHPTR